MSPKTAARLELARAIGGGLLSPFRYLAHVPGRGRAMAAIAEDVRLGEGAIDPPPDLALPKDRALRVFLSAAEASGEIHGASLVTALRGLAAQCGAPAPKITAIGGDRLRALGVETVGDPVARAQTGFDGVLQSLPYYVGLLRDAASHIQEIAPDVVVTIDSPALNVPLARMARRYGPPIVHLVAPQYWGWAPWRVKPYRRAVDLALTILPHEPRWYKRQRVNTKHVGHPLLDALAGIPDTRPSADSSILAILPGSRAGVIRRNLPWMLNALASLRAAHPNADVRILQSTAEHHELIEELTQGHDVRLDVGDLHDHLAKARAAFAVSGTVLTDVLYHRLPTVVVYRVSKRLETWMYKHVLTCPYFASTNLLAGKELVPEHCFRGKGPLEEVAAQVERAFGDEDTRQHMIKGFDEALRRLGPPGAIGRAARHVLAAASASSEASGALDVAFEAPEA